MTVFSLSLAARKRKSIELRVAFALSCLLLKLLQRPPGVVLDDPCRANLVSERSKSVVACELDSVSPRQDRIERQARLT